MGTYLEPITLERPLMGWPDTTIRLVMYGNREYTVTVGNYKPYEFKNGLDAMTFYYHPFACDKELEVDSATEIRGTLASP